MGKVSIPPIIPGAIPKERFSQNDDVPSQAALRRVAWAYNHAAVHQRKVLFAQSYATQATPDPISSSVGNIMFAFRTGENVHSVAFYTGLAPASQKSSDSAHVTLNLFDGSTLRTSPEKVYPKEQAGPYTPSEVAWVWGQIEVEPNTQYLGYLDQQHYCRVHSLTVYETASKTGVTSVTGIADPLRWETNKPIYDAGVQDLAETGTKLWQHNGAQLLSWSRHTVAAAPVVNSMTYANILGSGSVWSASQPGFHINTLYHDTIKHDVPVEFAAFVTRSAGTGDLELKLEQSGGTLLSATFSGTSPGLFSVVTGTIPAHAATKTDILARCTDASTTYEIHCVGLWEYEA